MTPTEAHRAQAKSPRNYACEFCGKRYLRNSHMRRHQRMSCTGQKEELQRMADELEEKDKQIADKDRQIAELREETIKQIAELREQLLRQQPTTTIGRQTNRTTHVQIVVNLRSYKNPDLSHLTSEATKRCLKTSMSLRDAPRGGMSCDAKLAELIYCSPSKPENHSVKLTNLRSPYLQVFEESWNAARIDDAILSVVDVTEQFVEETIDGWDSQGIPFPRTKSRNISHDQRGSETCRKLHEHVKLALYNNRDRLNAVTAARPARG